MICLQMILSLLWEYLVSCTYCLILIISHFYLNFDQLEEELEEQQLEEQQIEEKQIEEQQEQLEF